MSSEKETILSAHQNHAEFNKRFELTTPANDVVNGPWLSNEALNGLPNVRKAFDRSRDPTIAIQLDDIGKSEAERRDEQSSNRSNLKQWDQPKLELKPPYPARAQYQAQSPQNTQNDGTWLAKERDAVMNNQRSTLSRSEPTHDRSRDNLEPDLSP